MLACKLSNNNVSDHFAKVGKTVLMSSGAKPKTVIDYKLSRYACYLIVQNGDPKKEVIALGQTYFAVQTRKQEITEDFFNSLDENKKVNTLGCRTNTFITNYIDVHIKKDYMNQTIGIILCKETNRIILGYIKDEKTYYS